ncbi:energy transducer TonB [Thauera chlorobenzoica]|uniref:Ferric siderophore transport system protein TonB n=1 Tax=Thauera chlorobenzoica TaxID=96773 RepID=A0A1H5WT50_9RHOO|nr:energy transducer TonB [Thauera chlorobenzoica]APR04511.1 Ferric siderophore transport system protein TonB [Thauera chlorobenzoica]SEG02137.1 outer membrane transport energization protein TonB [Thauera chlorobenzoica]
MPPRAAASPRPGVRLAARAPGRIALASLVALTHAAGLGALVHFGMSKIEMPQPMPVQVALISAPQAAPEPQPVAAPEPPPQVQRPEPPPPKSRPKPPPEPRPKPVAKPPAPVTESPTALTQAAEAAPTPPAPAPAAAPRPAPAAAPAPITAARFDAAYLNNPAPAYPMLSRRMREEGQVMLRVLVSADGLPARIELRTSAGSERLDRAAQDAVARWRFVPARQGEHPVEAWVLVPIVFKLQGN